ncbi:MAG: hypothetical protein JNL11_15155 [Bdellovibrionaceae bacterium]|nr:hypothetical protein [Pseudobdellovibrionaceae bacterium]
MVRKALGFILLIVSTSYATEHYFNYSDITSPGDITEFPANFGSFHQGMSFSGSLNALNRFSYRPNQAEYKADRAPIAIEPRVLSSGLGQSWGGWGMVLKNNVEKIKLQSDTLESVEELRGIELHLGVGLKLSPMWNVGWGLTFNNDQQSKAETLMNAANMDTPVKFIDTQKEFISAQVGFGFLMESESFILGTHLKTPKLLISDEGKVKTRAWSLMQNQMIRQELNQGFDLKHNWELDLGVKFGTKGFTYSISDTYYFAGTHRLKGGFEYVGSWGRISTGLSRWQQANQSELAWSLGFCRSEKNFDWGVGPFYRVFKDTFVDRDEIGVLYSSQINY